MKYEFTNTPEFMERRKKRWKEHWSCYQVGVKKDQKEVIAAQKHWYLDGDLTPLLSLKKSAYRDSALGLDRVIALCPASVVSEFFEFLKLHSEWLSEHELSFWSDMAIETRDERFIESMVSRLIGTSIDVENTFFSELIRLMIPEEGTSVALPISLGNDDWKPSYLYPRPHLAFLLLNGIRSYLFDEDAMDYAHLKSTLNLVDPITNYHPEIFATESSDDVGVVENVGPGVNDATRKLMRAIVGNLLGYKNAYQTYEGPLRHNDAEFEEKVRKKLESLNMPESYKALVQYIEKNKDNYLYSEHE